MTLREGIRPTRPPIATRVALFGGLLHPHAALEGPSITSPRSSIRPRDDLEEENVALEASQMTPSPTLPLPKSPLNDLEGGPYARMRSQIRPLDDLL
jgi:hypothetical protein